MNKGIYINIYIRKDNAELFSTLKRGAANPNAVDANALLAIKTVLASRQLTEPERAEFEELTKGEVFDKIEQVEVHEQAPEPTLEYKKPPLENALPFFFGGITWMAVAHLYYGGSYPNVYLGLRYFVLGAVVSAMVQYFIFKVNNRRL